MKKRRLLFTFFAFACCAHCWKLSAVRLPTIPTFKLSSWGRGGLIANILCVGLATCSSSLGNCKELHELQPKPAFAVEIENKSVRRPSTLENYRHLTLPPVNIQSDDFWYPPFLLGRWDTTLRFVKAEFSPEVTLDAATSSKSIPGLSKYSIFPFPQVGKDIEHFTTRFVQVDSHPREDRPFNIRQRFRELFPTTTIDRAGYSWQKAPDWFHSPSNHWMIEYHDESGQGSVKLLTRKRELYVFAGTAESTEYIQQTHDRYERSGNNDLVKQHTVSDYALNWRFSIPASARDEFVETETISRSDDVQGQLNIFVFPNSQSDSYFALEGRHPMGVYSYDVTMKRQLADHTGDPNAQPAPRENLQGKELKIDDVKDSFDSAAMTANDKRKEQQRLRHNEIASVTYPFVWRSDGPVELDQYFGY